MSLQIEVRPVPEYNPADWPAHIPEIIQRIYVSRGIEKPETVEHILSKLIHWKELGSIGEAAKIIATAIRQQWVITVAGDFDCDGATGTSVAVRGLRMLGAQNVHFIVPNRFKHGYGLSPGLVDDMHEATQLIITVDSGTSNVDGVARAKELGRMVVITDHHLQGDVLPDADAIVNPNVKGDPFPSKALAGVGVMFYVLLATRAFMRLSEPVTQKEPDLVSLLDLVALGTVADLVPLDQNNRILVAAGMRRIRQGKIGPGLHALFIKAKKNIQEITAQDFAFAIAPRLNAAGRMEDMSVGITALISEDPQQIDQFVDMLEEINNSRKLRQQEMISEAETALASSPDVIGRGVVVYDPKWHSGIVGLVASKLKETLYRPVIALAPAESGSSELRGSCRSIPGFHLRDALAVVDARNPGLMKKFGGHAMAAGLSMHIDNALAFKTAFEAVAEELLTDEMLNPNLQIDGALPAGYFCSEFIDKLNECGPWGQGFPQPMFQNDFEVDDYMIIKEIHLKLFLIDPRDGGAVSGIQFASEWVDKVPSRIRVTYELGLNVFRGDRLPQLLIRHIESLE